MLFRFSASSFSAQDCSRSPYGKGCFLCVCVVITLAATLVELKNGETYNGHLVNCDTWMNIHLREVICTSKDGDRFWRMPECYIRGNTIKYLRVPDEVYLVFSLISKFKAILLLYSYLCFFVIGYIPKPQVFRIFI
ncbi:putative U6 snRNA-associated Sm-like protein LSm4 [Vitis vinifera]|uniref:U6 snRNA-associated Sm-like protein LSm4 n=1 Tax=Vitis vinifera TaxID=29760 RepID=A0A438D817_VITVI|nr:putative U6 snRNA-associated Sm-like protein LSm4 [Vitis vinifera]